MDETARDLVRDSHKHRRDDDERILWPFLKGLLLVVVLGFVAVRAYQLWQRDQAALEEIRADYRWLLAAAGAYLLGWLPSVGFWQRLMNRSGGRVGIVDTARAYYCGHLGKYVPGKAMVLVIRAALVKDRGCPAGPAALTAAYETLVFMGAGAAIAAGLSPTLLPSAARERLPEWLRIAISTTWFPPLLVAAVCLASLPLIAKLFAAVSTRIAPRESDVAERSPLEDRGRSTGPTAAVPAIESSTQIDSRLIAEGLLAFVAGWALHGLSLGCTLRAVSDAPFSLADWPLWTGSVALATVLGFVAVFAPGGVGVREGLLFETLSAQPHIAAHEAVAAAVYLRFVWFVVEMTAACVLFWLAGRSRSGQASRTP